MILSPDEKRRLDAVEPAFADALYKLSNLALQADQYTSKQLLPLIKPLFEAERFLLEIVVRGVVEVDAETMEARLRERYEELLCKVTGVGTSSATPDPTL